MDDNVGGLVGTGVMAGFIGVFCIIYLLIYLYISLCLFKIAKKCGVEMAWLAWIPIIAKTLMDKGGKVRRNGLACVDTNYPDCPIDSIFWKTTLVDFFDSNSFSQHSSCYNYLDGNCRKTWETFLDWNPYDCSNSQLFHIGISCFY